VTTVPVGQHTITVADPLPDDLCHALVVISHASRVTTEAA
jgi:hypothetical protein